MSNEALSKERVEAVPRGASNAVPVFAKKGKNARVWDVEGNEYIDFASGFGVLNVGHCHAKVVAATKEQAEHFSHTCWHVFMYEPYVHLAQKLNEMAPGASLRMVRSRLTSGLSSKLLGC